MATVINNPQDSSGTGVIVGIIIVIVLGALFFMYALPAIRSNNSPQENPGLNINVDLPSPGGNTGESGGSAY